MKQSKQVTITSIFKYPVKSMRGLEQIEGLCNGEGIIGDRRWMVIDSSGAFISQRHLPALAKVSVIVKSDHIQLSHADFEEYLLLPIEPQGDFVAESVTIWNDCLSQVEGYLDSQAWFNITLGQFRGKNLTLVKMPSVSQREVEPDLIGHGQAFTGFADGFPFLITNQNSLEKLNEALLKTKVEPIEMERFRPNIVVSGLDAFEEEKGGRMILECGASFELIKPCQRCQMITFDQKTGQLKERGQPTKALMQVQSIDPSRGAYFGQNAILNFNSHSTTDYSLANDSRFNQENGFLKKCSQEKGTEEKDIQKNEVQNHTNNQANLVSLKVGQQMTWLPNE
jgi:uncharacterized protein